MSFTKIISGVFAVIFVIILYLIIYYALKIMYKDVKGNGKKKSQRGKKAYGLEIIDAGKSENLKPGSIIPVREPVTIGRRTDNSIILADKFVSGSHAKVFVKNNEFYLEDLNSTNGTFVNGRKIEGRIKLNIKDEVRLGSTILKVIN